MKTRARINTKMLPNQIFDIKEPAIHKNSNKSDYNIISFFKIGDIITVYSPEFNNQDAMIFSKSKSQIWALIVPHIDYNISPEQKIKSQNEISLMNGPDYSPPMNLFDENKVIGSKKIIISINSFKFQCVNWDSKFFYKEYQIINIPPSIVKYKCKKNDSIFANFQFPEILFEQEEDKKYLERIHNLQKRSFTVSCNMDGNNYLKKGFKINDDREEEYDKDDEIHILKVLEIDAESSNTNDNQKSAIKKKKGRPKTQKVDNSNKQQKDKDDFHNEKDNAADVIADDIRSIPESMKSTAESSNTNDNQKSAIKKKKGRPKLQKEDDSNNQLKIKSKKKMNNNERMQMLDNPHIESVESNQSFVISVPCRKNQVTALYDPSKFDDSNWKVYDIEQIFQGETEDKSINCHTQSDIPLNHPEEEEENEINFSNIDKYEPFSKYSDIRSFVSGINKGCRVVRLDTTDPDSITFGCSRKNCSYRIEFHKKDDGFYHTYYCDHSCNKQDIIDRKLIIDAVKKHGKTEHITKEYRKAINESLGLLDNPLNYQRIKSAYNTAHELSVPQRKRSWKKLQSFIDEIINTGGYGAIHRIDEDHIDFVGMVPNYSVRFINSDMFFRVCQLDSRFQTGISDGHFYELVTLTGNRSILPVAVAWAVSESKEYTRMLLNLLHNELHRIQSCHTDEAGALISPIEEARIANILCTWHLSKHCPCPETFKSLVKSQTSLEYFTKKNKIIRDSKSLKEYLDKKNKWQKISRFESETPRDLNTASTAAESFNAFLKNNDFQNKEPLEVLQAVYDFGFFSLKNICRQKGPLTDAIDNWLSYAMPVAENLTVNQTINQYKFEVTKDGENETKCTVIILPSETPQCPCRFYNDCGMPCVHILAVSLKLKLDWSIWIHPRYFVSNYQFHFHNLKYPDFDKLTMTDNDCPAVVTSLKKRQSRIETPGNITPKKK